MKTHEFYRWYANLPLGKRMEQIGTFEDNTYPLTPEAVYARLQKLDDLTRDYDIERDKLLRKVDWFLIQGEKKRSKSKK